MCAKSELFATDFPTGSVENKSVFKEMIRSHCPVINLLMTSISVRIGIM